jgi:hypothetical protein
VRLYRFNFMTGVIMVLCGTSSTLAADALTWHSVQGLFPGPKPERWLLSPSDLAPWDSQATHGSSLSGMGSGDERTWEYQDHPALAVAVRMPFRVGCRQGPRGFVVGVLDSNRTLIARSSQLFSEGSDSNSTGLLYRLDTAPYRIADTETAFGLRIVHFKAGKHWCYADQVLHLFRVVGKDVVRILTTDAFYEQLDQIELAHQHTDEASNQLEDDPDCSFTYTRAFPPKGEGAVFRMLSTRTKGFYDIQRTQKGGPTVTFRWDGQRYVMDGKDPVDHHVRDEWDWCTGRRSLASWGSAS